MELKVEFSAETEFTRVKSTLAKIEWYKSKGYKPRLPEGITKESSDDDILNQIKKEFDEKKYIQASNEILSAFSTIKEQLEKVLNEVFNKVPDTHDVILTNYGVGGSYESPNRVIFNINNKNGRKTIIHEIIQK